MCDHVGVFLLKLRQQFRGVQVRPWDPLIVCFWIPLPMHQVLYLTPTSKTLRVDDTLHFVFFFSIDKIREWPFKVAPVELCLLVWRKEIHMKHRVDTPLFWKAELIGHWSQDFGDGKGAVLFGANFVVGCD